MLQVSEGNQARAQRSTSSPAGQWRYLLWESRLQQAKIKS